MLVFIITINLVCVFFNSWCMHLVRERDIGIFKKEILLLMSFLIGFVFGMREGMSSNSVDKTFYITIWHLLQ